MLRVRKKCISRWLHALQWVYTAESETSVDASWIGESFVNRSVKVGRRAINECCRLSGLVLGPAGVLEACAEFWQEPVLGWFRLAQPTTKHFHWRYLTICKITEKEFTPQNKSLYVLSAEPQCPLPDHPDFWLSHGSSAAHVYCIAYPTDTPVHSICIWSLYNYSTMICIISISRTIVYNTQYWPRHCNFSTHTTAVKILLLTFARTHFC